MRLGYNTNGFAFHRLDDAIDILHELGYRAVALTLDVHHLDPFAPNAEAEARRIGAKLNSLDMACVVETGSRFLLDARRKHQPTLVSPTPAERAARADFLRRCVQLAGPLGAACVSFWSGAAVDAAAPAVQLERLLAALAPVAAAARNAGVSLALEPEPGMSIDTVAAANPILDALGFANVGLTVDVGHLHCQREGDPAAILKACGSRLLNVHLDDARRDVHDHLQLGAGEIDFVPLAAALHEMGFQGVASVELSRHAHDAVNAARTALERWRQAEAAA